MKTCLRLFASFALLMIGTNCLIGQAGTIDQNFGENGYVTANLGSNGSQFTQFVAQSDGKLLAFGYHYFGEIKLVRYLSNGQLDTGFGADGVATANEETTSTVAGGLTPDGKIVVAFTKSDPNGILGSTLIVARFKSDGELDAGFGTNGMLNLASLGTVRGLSEAIHTLSNGDFIVIGLGVEGQKQIIATKVKANGTLDNGFGTDGKLSLGTSHDMSLVKSARQVNNRIVIASSGWDHTAFNLHQIFDNGVRDPSFGSDGFKEMLLQNYLTVGGICTYPSGQIAVAISEPGSTVLTIKKFKTNGTNDSSFGGDGSSTIHLSESATASGIALQLDGKLLIGGMAGLGEGEDFVVGRFNADGTPDASFGNDGIAKHLDPAHNHCSTNMLMQPDGKLLLGGFTQGTGLSSMVRYLTGAVNGTSEGVKAVSDLGISPNPVTGAAAAVNFTLKENTTVTFEVFDMAGQLLSTSTKQLLQGPQKEQVQVADLPAGTYLLSIKTGNGHATEKLVRAK
ncbi:MAG: T9SS type A sorting domain-containing protein [Saprospiraceae bacterium]|nr:T9SS type A sorting domain-containing protein [Saprospiraceae bacterium]